jgi:hypothetical protein
VKLVCLPETKRRFVLLGIRGQMIFVNPGLKLAMVHTAVRPKPADPQASWEAIALWSASEQQFDGGARQLQATTRTEAFGLANPVISFWHWAAIPFGIRTGPLFGAKLTADAGRRDRRP